MSIRNRVLTIDGISMVASQTNLIVGAFRMPAKGRVKGVRVHSVTVAGGTPTVSVMQNPGVADSTGALSTTLVHDAAISVAASDTVYADPMTGQYPIEKGVWLFVKYTTAVGVTSTSTTIQVEVDY